MSAPAVADARRAVRVGLLGLGTVGSGTMQVLRRNAEAIRQRAGRPIEVTRVAVRDPRRARAVELAGIRLGDDPHAVVSHAEVDVVGGLIGGLEPAHALVQAALAQGKHVVTANKALIAVHGNELLHSAQQHGVSLAFEAAVGGGIPIIKALHEALAGNRVLELVGIINGTCNYILSAMENGGRDFDAVLAEAQRLGYAEADPGFDVDGVDATHKLAILAAIAFGIPIDHRVIYTEGIRGVTTTDVAYAEQLGYRIKHLAVARTRPEGIELRVHPALVPCTHMLAGVHDAMNAVLVQGDAAGPMLYYGAGAGGEQTASAVIADLVDITRSMHGPQGIPAASAALRRREHQRILPMDEAETACYLRMQVRDRPGVLAQIAGLLGEAGISIESVLQ